MSHRTASKNLTPADKSALSLVAVFALGDEGGYTSQVTRKAYAIIPKTLNPNEVKEALEQNKDILIHRPETRGENCPQHHWAPKDMDEVRKRITDYFTNPIIQRTSNLSLEKIEEKVGTIQFVAWYNLYYAKNFNIVENLIC